MADRTARSQDPRGSKHKATSRPPREPGTPPGGSDGPPPFRIGPLSWLILALLILWNAWAFMPHKKIEVAIPYSEFVSQTASGNVKAVTITGAAITGSFAHPLTWPPPKAQPTSGSGSKGKPATQGNAAGHGKPTAKGANPAESPPEFLAPSRTNARSPSARPQHYSRFDTTYPADVGDPTLMPLLRAKHVSVNVQSPSPPWFELLLTDGLPIVLMLAVLVWMGRQASRSQSGMFGFGRNRARRYTEDRPGVTFADVAGADEAKQDLREVVDFLSHPTKYLAIGARIPRGVLLVGPPGTGKTLLARAVAGEAGVPFFHISGSEFVEMFVGVGASRVRDLFAQAKAAQPAIVFVDELDAVGRRRGAGVGAVNDEREQTLNQLLVEMDGFDQRQQIILLAATNRPDVLDPAMLRPGRFDRQVVVPLPDWRGRHGILRIHTRQLQLAQDVNLERLARTAIGLSGADLANLCNEAALMAARENRKQIGMEDFERAWDKILLGAERRVVMSPKDRRVTAYHESGHAIVAWLTPAADPVRRVTIVPHGRALGVTEQLPAEERYNMSKADLLARLDVMLGGRTSESLVIGEITTGAENDLVQATRLARRMIARWGMGSLGPVAFEAGDEQPFLGYQISPGRDYSEATAARIDREVESLLGERQNVALRLLTAARDRLDALVETLLKEETIGEEQLTRILGPRPAVEVPSKPERQPAVRSSVG
ncbi:MAG TPA: ATP-dependent zinc metalloprotease FtsH [Steroidobacteraceae bacterium]|jgi:cell division protease FtsH|nr:ATP-dependent zinc metalloprotease FtsH [Steroidobacteraceae bacterium]